MLADVDTLDDGLAVEPKRFLLDARGTRGDHGRINGAGGEVLPDLLHAFGTAQERMHAGHGGLALARRQLRQPGGIERLADAASATNVNSGPVHVSYGSCQFSVVSFQLSFFQLRTEN